jgi:hypothetical protein
LVEFTDKVSTLAAHFWGRELMEVIHRRCSGLDVHKETVVACVRLALDGQITREVRTFETTTSGLLLLLAWLTELGCTHVAMEATGVYFCFFVFNHQTISRKWRHAGLRLSARPLPLTFLA